MAMNQLETLSRFCYAKSARRLIKLSRGIATEPKTDFHGEGVDSKDVFGTLSRSGSKMLATETVERYLADDKDAYDKEEFDLDPRKNAYYYKYEISKYARQGKLGIRRALELFHQMKAKDRLTPEIGNYSPLIYGCAKAGYTKKAFELFEDSLECRETPTKSTVTCLINACAESPFPEYGLQRLEWLKENLKFNHDYQFNRSHFHCLIKAYGKLGQLDSASKTLQEMLDQGLLPDTKTFSMLLIGCISNKEAGAAYALRVFKRMRLYDIPRDTVIYNLILRSIRDCGMGSPELIEQTLGELPAMTSFEQKLLFKKHLSRKGDLNDSKNFVWMPLLTDMGKSIASAVKPDTQKTLNIQEDALKISTVELENKKTDESTTSHSNVALLSQSHPLPNLLSDNHLELACRIEKIDSRYLYNPRNRLMLFGKMHGYLEAMTKDGCPPDNKTFSLLITCVNKTKEFQLEYYRLAQDYGIKRDLLFYDMLIRHVATSLDDKRLDRALYFLREMQKDGLRPNISTFEALAFGCDTLQRGKQLIKDLENCGFTVSDQLIQNLFSAALGKSLQFNYLNWLIKLSKDKNFKPDKSLVERLEERRIAAKEVVLKYEKNQLPDSELPEWLSEGDRGVRKFDFFSRALGTWLENVELYQEEHPWKHLQYERESKKAGFHRFVQTFKTLDKLKKDALKKGAEFGNLAKKLNEQKL